MTRNLDNFLNDSYSEEGDDFDHDDIFKYKTDKKTKKEQVIMIHSKSELKALKEVEKAVRLGLSSCKEVKRLQSISQSLRDIVQMTNPKKYKIKRSGQAVD